MNSARASLSNAPHHAIGGLSRNDFVLASKLQAVITPPSES
jgi:hypothetical protein